MTLSIQSSFVKPYFIPKLGTDGLTSEDIAKSTRRPVHVINQMVTRPSFKKLCKTNGYKLITTVINSKSRGRPGRLFLLCKRAAKAAIATGGWFESHRYLDFLFECEEVATELMPKVLAENKRLEAENEALKASAEQPKQLNKGKFAIVPVFGKNLWDEDEVIAYEYVDKETASPVDVARGKLHHNAKVQKGLLRSSEKAQSIVNHAINGIKKTTLILWQNPDKDI